MSASHQHCHQLVNSLKKLTLSNEEANPNAAHVEPVKPRLHVQANLFLVLATLPLKYALGDRRHSRVVPTFDSIETFRKARIIVAHLGRPVDFARVCEVPTVVKPRSIGMHCPRIPSFHGGAVLCTGLYTRTVWISISSAKDLVHSGIRRCFWELEAVRVGCVERLSDLVRKGWLRKRDKLL